MAKKNILVATREIHGGTDKGGRHVLKAQEELTAAEAKKLGLDDDAVTALVEGGALIEVPAHITGAGSSSDDAALKAADKRATEAEARASEAEQKAAKLEEEVKTLTGQLEEARKAAKPAAQA